MTAYFVTIASAIEHVLDILPTEIVVKIFTQKCMSANVIGCAQQ